MKAEGRESSWPGEDEPEDCDVCCAAALDDAETAEKFWAIEIRLAGTAFCSI